jgi:hypothetical protein
MKALIVGLVLLLAVVLLVVGWLIALPSIGRYILIGALVVAFVAVLLMQMSDVRRYLRIRAM